MKTSPESSLEVLKDILPRLEAQEDYSNDALYAMLCEYVKEKRIQEWLCDVADPYRSVRKTDDTGWRNGVNGSLRKRRIHLQDQAAIEKLEKRIIKEP